MILKIFIGLATVFGLTWSFKIKDKKSIIICVGLAFGVTLVFIPIPVLKTLGLIIYIAFSILSVLYGLTKRTLKTIERFIICLIAIPVMFYWFFAIQHYPGLGIIRLTLLLSIIAFVTGLFKKQTIKAELGFLSILTMDAVILILEQWI